MKKAGAHSDRNIRNMTIEMRKTFRSVNNVYGGNLILCVDSGNRVTKEKHQFVFKYLLNCSANLLTAMRNILKQTSSFRTNNIVDFFC